jgi:hypothetical protein
MSTHNHTHDHTHNTRHSFKGNPKKRSILEPSPAGATTNGRGNKKKLRYDENRPNQDPIERLGRAAWAVLRNLPDEECRYVKFHTRNEKHGVADWAFGPTYLGDAKQIAKYGTAGVHFAMGYFQLGEMVKRLGPLEHIRLPDLPIPLTNAAAAAARPPPTAASNRTPKSAAVYTDVVEVIVTPEEQQPSSSTTTTASRSPTAANRTQESAVTPDVEVLATPEQVPSSTTTAATTASRSPTAANQTQESAVTPDVEVLETPEQVTSSSSSTTARRPPRWTTAVNRAQEQVGRASSSTTSVRRRPPRMTPVFTPRSARAQQQQVVTVMTPPAKTVGTETLDSILIRIEQCKTTLQSGDTDVPSQLAAANLIEKLAQAAVAVKKLEDLGI